MDTLTILTIKQTKKYLEYIEEHYWNVQKAWKIIQEKGQGQCWPFLYDDFKFVKLDIAIRDHDVSKLSKEEFIPYRMKFFPIDKEEKKRGEKAFRLAWKKHLARNAHHWENWTQKDSMYVELNTVHNVCDWMAMGMKFNDTAREYYEKHKDKIHIPEWAEKLMYEIFDVVYGKVGE